MRYYLFLPALVTLCLVALVACGGTAFPAPSVLPAPMLPTTDPREEEREPASHLVAELDLRELPTLPVVAVGEQSPIALLYETSAGIAEGVTFYKGELSARSWRERADEGYVQEHAGLLVMEKAGALLSASISDLGETRMVQLRHHGNADVGALPLYPEAELIFAQSPQLIYAVSAPVAEVGDFTRAALAKQGWIAYQRPFTDYAEDPSRQLLSLTRDGTNLSVMVAVASAQGGRTTVQYLLGLLPVDLPLPADAAHLLLDPELPYASYTTGAGQAELLALYRSAMPTLGWREQPAAAQIDANSTTLLFLRGEEQATLELRGDAAGHTVVLLSPPAPGRESQSPISPRV
jgi:hypothetical protein